MSILSTVLGWVVGNTGKGVVATVAEETSSVAKELTKDPDNSQLQYTVYASHNTWFDIIVDGIGRLIRPGVTIWLFGGIAGAWPLPPPKQIDPAWFELAKWAFGFWFGRQALLKDLPALIRSIKG